MEDENRIVALNHRIAAAIQNQKQRQRRRQTAFRTVGAIAAIVVLLAAISLPLRWIWFESWSTPDEQQHVIMGHEITVDMVATAIAEHGTADRIVIEDFTQIPEMLGLDLRIPERLGDEWIASAGYIDYPRGYIKITVLYSSLVDPSKAITVTVCLYTDIEYAYFSFEQTREGEFVGISGIDLYVSDNIERASASWYNNTMYIRVVGDVDRTEITKIAQLLIGGK